jgi:hypothetical protein
MKAFSKSPIQFITTYVRYMYIVVRLFFYTRAMILHEIQEHITALVRYEGEDEQPWDSPHYTRRQWRKIERKILFSTILFYMRGNHEFRKEIVAIPLISEIWSTHTVYVVEDYVSYYYVSGKGI